MDKTNNGIEYDWGLSGPDGAWFELRPIKGKHTEEDVAEAKRQLRRDQDVTSLSISWQ